MENRGQGDTQDQLEQHSLPGTNQAGKGPEKNDQESRPGGGAEHQDQHGDLGDKQDQLEEHSLPGTNQAGKEVVSCEENDQENRPGGGAASRPA